MQVLVVEDEALIRILVCDLLADAGFACISAADAIEALTLLDHGHLQPDILVTDFNLGLGPNGQILASEALRRLPGLGVTFITGNPEAFDDYRLQSWERLVAKPFAGAELVDAIVGLRAHRNLGLFGPRPAWYGLPLGHAALSV